MPITRRICNAAYVRVLLHQLLLITAKYQVISIQYNQIDKFVRRFARQVLLDECGVLPARAPLYQTRSAWSMDQRSTTKRSAVHNFVPTVTKFCVMWEGLSLPHDTKFGNCRGKTVDRRVIFIWSLTHGSSWSGLIKVGPVCNVWFPRYSIWIG